ncbi:unnamed protein product [Haemonchus placei]|uniref:Uncharacterized protein n=1 Tax=Haemonchus placei TaxID=6290 RepID=A0A158QPM0_HAEPC|nr:unnamed protein product [Haemonchus placei]
MSFREDAEAAVNREICNLTPEKLRLTGKESGDQAVEPSVNEKNHELNRLSLIQIVIFFQFTIAAALTIFAVVGVSVNQPIGFILLLALLQFLITVPGFAYYFTRKPAHFFAYLLLQAITGGSEVIWFIYSVITNTYTVIHLLILILLICVQTVALLAATILKHVHINLSDEASTKMETRRGRRRRGSSKSSGSGSGKRGRRVSRSSSQEDGTSKVGEISSPSSPPRKRFSRDLEQGPDKSIRSTGRRKLLGDSMLNVKEGRRRILELAQQLRDRQVLGRRHSDPSLNAKNDEKSEKSVRKSKSTESSSLGRRTAPETLPTPIPTGQQSPFQNVSSSESI